MPRFTITTRDPGGQKFTKTVTAKSKAAATRQVKAQLRRDFARRHGYR